MKTVLIFAALIALALSKPVIITGHAELVERQKSGLRVFDSANQPPQDADFYVVGKDVKIEAYIENYTNKGAAAEFLVL